MVLLSIFLAVSVLINIYLVARIIAVRRTLNGIMQRLIQIERTVKVLKP